MLTNKQREIHYGMPEHTDNEKYLSNLRYKKPLEHYNIYNDKCVLDCGAAWCYGARQIAKIAKHVLCLDANIEALNLGKQYLLSNMEQIHMNAHEMDFENEFDTIVLVECYEHMDTEELELTLKNIHTALKSNGWLYISTPELRGNKKDFPKGSHWMEYTYDEVITNVESFGFKLEKLWKRYDTISNGFLFRK